MADNTHVKITGLREVQRALRAVSEDARKDLKTGFRAIAEDVIGKIRPKVAVVSGSARDSLKPRASTRGAAIAFGGTKAPYYPWLDFGGNAGPNKRIHRTFIKTGRYVYPTLADENEKIIDAADDVIKQALVKHGFDTKGDN